MSSVAALASVVATLAALGALYLARRTVVEQREMRAEERHARRIEDVYHLLEAASAVVESAKAGVYEQFAVAQLRLDTLLVEEPGDFVACRELVTTDEGDVFEVWLAARDEVHAELERLRKRPALGTSPP
jgi:hypothetical protein